MRSADQISKDNKTSSNLASPLSLSHGHKL
jgi:hypothetical protein